MTVLRRMPGRRATGAFLATAMLCGLTMARGQDGSAGPVHTAETVSVSATIRWASKPDFDKLEKQVEKLNKKYRGQLREVTDAKETAKKAQQEAKRLTAELQAAQDQLAQLAAARYMNGIDPAMDVFASANGESLNGESATEYLARANGGKAAELRRLVGQAASAQQNADTQLKRLQQALEDIKSRRGKIEKMMNRYKPQSPLTGDRVTARMKKVREAIDRRFGPFPSIGCYRANAGEHTEGRACDFMESAGVMPSAERQAHGDRVSQYAIDEARSLGVMYIIWKQRIYDMRSGSGWRQMSDRGSITANHFDHVHISVF